MEWNLAKLFCELCRYKILLKTDVDSKIYYLFLSINKKNSVIDDCKSQFSDHIYIHLVYDEHQLIINYFDKLVNKIKNNFININVVTYAGINRTLM